MTLLKGFCVEEAVLVGYEYGCGTERSQGVDVGWVAVVFEQGLFIFLVEFGEDGPVGEGH
jgi:hypothetical protein